MEHVLESVYTVKRDSLFISKVKSIQWGLKKKKSLKCDFKFRSLGEINNVGYVHVFWQMFKSKLWLHSQDFFFFYLIAFILVLSVMRVNKTPMLVNLGHLQFECVMISDFVLQSTDTHWGLPFWCSYPETILRDHSAFAVEEKKRVLNPKSV